MFQHHLLHVLWMVLEVLETIVRELLVWSNYINKAYN